MRSVNIKPWNWPIADASFRWWVFNSCFFPVPPLTLPPFLRGLKLSKKPCTKIGRNGLTAGPGFTREMPCGLGRLWRCRNRVVFWTTGSREGFEETSGNANLTCCYSLTVWKWCAFENALIKQWYVGEAMFDSQGNVGIIFQIGICLEPQNPPNRWVQSGFSVGYETTYNKPGTSEPFCFCRPINDFNVVNFWWRRFIFWFFGSRKLPEMFCSGPVSHEEMLMLLTQFFSDLKNLLRNV